MGNYKLVSSKRIIAKLIADLDLQENDIRISDIIEWIGEAVEKIGGYRLLAPKVSGVDGSPYLKIACHRAELPCDIYNLHQVAFSICPNGPWIPMRKSTSTMNLWGSSCCTTNCGNCACCDCNFAVDDDILVKLTIDLIGNIDKSKALEILNTNQNTKTILTNLIKTHNINTSDFGKLFENGFDLQYTIKPGEIITNIPNGYLKISYSGIPTDENYYPMVPDLASYQEAVMWYISKKLLYPKKLRGEIDRRDYSEIQQSWNFYRKQAYAELMMPDNDDMESIKNTWNKLIPEFHDHGNFYNRTGERQIFYHQT